MVLFTPVVNELLTVLEVGHDVGVRGGDVKAFEDGEVVGVLGVFVCGVLQW